MLHEIDIDKIEGTVSGQSVSIEQDSELRDFWSEFTLKRPNQNLFNGVIFELMEAKVSHEQALFIFRKSSYSALHYARHLGRPFAFCHTAVFIYDTGGSFLTAWMSDSTSGGRRIVLPGGGLDDMDLVGGRISFPSAAAREAMEELGLVAKQISFQEKAWVVETHQGNRFAVILRMRVPSVDEFVRLQKHLIDKSEIAEISCFSPDSLKALYNKGEAIESYLLPVVEAFEAARYT